MNKQQIQALVEVIQKIVAAEVKSRMITLKTEITRQVLHEIKTASSRVPGAPKVNNKKIYSTNPLLNEVLSQTEMNIAMLKDDVPVALDETGQPINITVQDSSGKMVNLKNPAVQSVLEAMNRRYDGFDKPAPKPVQSTPKPVQPPVVNPELAKNYAKAMMDITDDDIESGNIFIPDPFNEVGR